MGKLFTGKEHSLQDSFRYGNLKAILAELKELSYFDTDSELPSKWSNGIKELAKLSESEYTAFKECIRGLANVIASMEYHTRSPHAKKAIELIIESIDKEKEVNNA